MKQRLVALDVFRGLTVALMILVNNPGSWGHIHPPLRHAAWHGLTPTDLVFPFFLFIVGVAISLGFSSRLESGDLLRNLIQKIFTRTVVIFSLGLLLNGFPFGLLGSGTLAEVFSHLRIMGVLQRIAVCYLLVGMTAVLLPGLRGRLLAVTGWLLFYELMMRLPMVAGWGGGSFVLDDNFIRFVDLKTLGSAHLYSIGVVAFDPEGLLSTLPAAATTMLGFFTGEFLRRPLELKERIGKLTLAGVLLSGLGLNLALVEPLNKQLWTTSYVALTGGLALLVLALCVWIIDGRRWHRGIRPAIIFGRNPLVVFVGSGMVARLLYLIKVTGPEGNQVSLKHMLYKSIFEPLAGPVNGSLLFAITFVGLWMMLLWWMDSRGIHIKV